MLPVGHGRDYLLQDRHELHPSSPGVGARNDGQAFARHWAEGSNPSGVGRSANCRTTVRFEKTPAMSIRRQAPPIGSAQPFLTCRGGSPPALLIQGQPESQNESSCAPRHTGAPSWRSGWVLTVTLTSEATSPLVESARTAGGSHIAKDDRNAVLDGPGKREGPSCSPDSFALKGISPGRWASSGQPERRPRSRARAVANASDPTLGGSGVARERSANGRHGVWQRTSRDSLHRLKASAGGTPQARKGQGPHAGVEASAM